MAQHVLMTLCYRQQKCLWRDYGCWEKGGVHDYLCQRNCLTHHPVGWFFTPRLLLCCLRFKVSSLLYLNSGRPQLIVYDDTYGTMQAVQVITIPQGAIINTNDKEIFFFGCLRPNTNKVDMKRAGLYDYSDIIGNTGKTPFEAEVCSKLRLS